MAVVYDYPAHAGQKGGYGKSCAIEGVKHLPGVFHDGSNRSLPYLSIILVNEIIRKGKI